MPVWGQMSLERLTSLLELLSLLRLSVHLTGDSSNMGIFITPVLPLLGS